MIFLESEIQGKGIQAVSFSEIILAPKAIPSLSLNSTRVFISSVQWEGPRMLAPAVASGLYPLERWTIPIMIFARIQELKL